MAPDRLPAEPDLKPNEDPSLPASADPPQLLHADPSAALQLATGAANAVAPLQIHYSATQVLSQVEPQLRRTRGVVTRDRSPLAESFRMLRSQVLQRMHGDGHKLLAVTSPRAIHGKSLTAVNLALTMAADLDTSVLLLDADLAGRALQRLFGLPARPGLSDYLGGKCGFATLLEPTRGEDAAHETLRSDLALSELLLNPGLPRFVFLPAGRYPVVDSAELLASKAVQQLTDEMKQRYPDRIVVVDLPPLLDTADALAFLPQADTTLLVVEEHTTSVADLENSAELLAPFNLIGCVLSQPPGDDGPPEVGRRIGRWLARGGRSDK